MKAQPLFSHIAEQQRFYELVDMFPALKRLCEEGKQQLQQFDLLLADIWVAFYCTEKVHFVAGDDFHATFMNELLKAEQYCNWSMLTQYDDLLSLITTLSMAEQILKDVEQQQKFTQYDTAKQYKQSPVATSMNIARMLEASKQQSQQLKEAVVQMHGLEGKKLQETPLKDQLLLANELQHNESVKKIAELTGRFKRIALKKFKTKEQLTMQRKDVTLGQEISRLLPLELASFIMPQSKRAFYRKFVEHETMIFDHKGKEASGRGPIVICMDESSSMSFLKEESKAFCLAMLQIAKKQGRDVAVVPFATTIGETIFFEKGHASTAAITSFSNTFLGGGTNYEKALTEALHVLTNSKFKKADMLFVTDGSSFLSSQFIAAFNESKKQKQFRCTSIVLTNMFNAVDISLVQKFSDQVIEAHDLFSAHKAFTAIL